MSLFRRDRFQFTDDEKHGIADHDVYLAKVFYGLLERGFFLDARLIGNVRRANQEVFRCWKADLGDATRSGYDIASQFQSPLGHELAKA